MNLKGFSSFIIATLFTCVSCKNKDEHADSISYLQKLIPLDHQDTKYSRGIPLDTTLSTGWKIEYLVKNDSTKYHDVFIRWSKGKKVGLFHGKNLLDFRTYFVPELSGENNQNIFMSHGCATSCAAVLVLNKIDMTYKDFEDIAGFDIKTNRIVWFRENKVVNNDDYRVTITDLSTAKDTSVVFRNMALGPIKSAFIDTIIYRNNSVSIRCTLHDQADYYRQKDMTETKTVFFK